MPVMDGPAAAAAIREREAVRGLPRTPIIALTANVMSHQTAAYIAGGMDEVVAKPIDFKTLIAAIQRQLDGGETGEAAEAAVA
jgi:CheY-like chemotaxis protein